MARLGIAAACGAVLVGSFLLVSGLLGGAEAQRASATSAVPAAAPDEAHAQSPDVATPPPAAFPSSASRSDPTPSDAAWREAARAAERQEEAQREAILGPAREGDVPLERRLERFREALHAHLEGTPQEDLLEARGMLAEVFFRLDVVQRELAAMSPGERQGAIDRVRRGLGFPEEEIRALEELDARREARWQNGAAYMQERRRLVETFDGDALEDELRALRERRFGFEAPTIAREEQGGFFRYERPRVYGRN